MRLLSASAVPAKVPGYMGGHMRGDDSGVWLWWPVMGAVCLALLVLVVWLTVSWTGRRTTGPASPGEAPRQILARRFAHGEIDAEEYHDRLEQLRKGEGGGR